MALSDKALPFGLRDVKITPISEAGVLGTPIDLPVARTFSFSEAEDFTELRGDDGLAAIRGQGASVEWELEGGGISLEVWEALSGATLTTSGVTPVVKKSLKKKGAHSRPYFKVEGQAISDSGGDFHAILFKCRASDSLEGELADGEFWLTSAGGSALPNGDDDLYEFIHNETAVAIA